MQVFYEYDTLRDLITGLVIGWLIGYLEYKRMMSLLHSQSELASCHKRVLFDGGRQRFLRFQLRTCRVHSSPKQTAGSRLYKNKVIILIETGFII